MKPEDTNELAKTNQTNKPHVNIGTFGRHKPNLTLTAALLCASSLRESTTAKPISSAELRRLFGDTRKRHE